MQDGAGPTVLVVGLGDLGGRCLEMLAAHRGLGRLVGCGAAGPRADASVGQAALVADTLHGPTSVEHVAADLHDPASAEDVLRRVDPAVVVFAASRHSWWRTPDAFRSVPYGVWLPLQATLLRAFMQGHRAAASTAPVVALPYPDAAGPVLAAEGLAPHTGAGNVSEVAAKIRLLAADEHGCHRDEVDVRLVLHHAAERLAFGVFATTPSTGGSPPYLARVSVRGQRLDDAAVDRLLRAPYPLTPGTGSHQLTAATAASLVDALVGTETRRLHVPAPAGLPGGYPALVGPDGIALDLPDDVPLAEAVRVNEEAATHDGIAGIDATGTIRWTDDAVTATRAALGLDLEPVAPAGLDAAADRLAAALRDHV